MYKIFDFGFLICDYEPDISTMDDPWMNDI